MAQGDLRGNLTASVASVANPTNLTGSVAVSLRDLIFVAFSQQTSLTATTVTDNLGNTYTAINGGTDAGTVTLRCYRAVVTVAGTLTTISVAATASTNDASGVAAVIEGPFFAAPLDANPANGTDATSPFDCPATGTLAQADEVIMAAIAVASNQTVASTSPSTLSGTVARANVSTGVSRRRVTSTSTVTPQFTGTDATSVQTTASFRLAKLLIAEAGSYTLTGTAADLERGREVVADAGSYALTGSAATISKGIRLTAEAGSYSLTGSTADLERGYETAADAGSYTLTGTDASLELGREVVAGAGSYSLTGTDATLTYTPGAAVGSIQVSFASLSVPVAPIVAGAGSYTLTGTAATLLHGWEVAADAGSYTFTGIDASLEFNREVNADAGSYALTGTDASLEYGRVVIAGAGSYTLSGNAADLIYSGGAATGRIEVSFASFTTPLAPIVAGAGSYTLTGTDASLEYGREVTADAGSYSLTGTDASLEYGREITADPGSYALTGTDASLVYFSGWTISADPGSYTLTGTDADLIYGAVTVPARGGGWLEPKQVEKSRRKIERERREAWKRLEEDIEEAYAEATGQPRKKVKPLVKEALAARDPEAVKRIAERLSVSTDPAAVRLTQRIDARVSEIEQLARLIAEIEQEAALARMRDEDDAIALLLMAN